MTERDRLDELGHELPWDRPDEARRAAVRASLLAAADSQLPASNRHWALGGMAFAAGVAAAAIAAFVMWPRGADPTPSAEVIAVEASSTAQLEHTTTRTETGSEEIVRVHAGRARIVVGDAPTGDRVRVATADAEIDGAATYEIAVAGDRLTEVSVQRGRAIVRVVGQQPVFLAAGQSWHAAVITADLSPRPASDPPAPASTDPRAAPTDPTNTMTPTTNPTTPSTNATTPSTNATAPSTNAMTSSTNTTTRPATTSANLTTPSTNPDNPTIPSTNATAPPANAPATSSTNPASRARPPATQPPVPAPATSSTIPSTPPAGPTPTTDPAIAINPPPIVTPGVRAKTPTEQHFQAGWALLRAGKSADAAIELGAAADAGGGELASDARYFQAVALIRAGHGSQAERALIAFLDHAARSSRRGRAAIMLGRLIAARGDRAAARAWFESALHDSDPTVVEAARAEIATHP